MTSEPCDACGRPVTIAGGLENLWTFEPDASTGMTLILDDDSEHFLCFSCIERLPENPELADVEALDSKDLD